MHRSLESSVSVYAELFSTKFVVNKLRSNEQKTLYFMGLMALEEPDFESQYAVEVTQELQGGRMDLGAYNSLARIRVSLRSELLTTATRASNRSAQGAIRDTCKIYR